MKQLLIILFICCFISCGKSVKEEIVITVIENETAVNKSYKKIKSITKDTVVISYIDSLLKVRRDNALVGKGMFDKHSKDYPDIKTAIEENIKSFE